MISCKVDRRVRLLPCQSLPRATRASALTSSEIQTQTSKRLKPFCFSWLTENDRECMHASALQCGYLGYVHPVIRVAPRLVCELRITAARTRRPAAGLSRADE